MSIMEKLKALFQGDSLPDETRQLYQSASSTRDLVKGLETLRARNEIDLRDNEEQLIGLEKAIVAEENSIRKGGLTTTEEMIVLRRIERLGKQRANLEKQVSIYHENVNLHLNLIAKIQEMEAMRSRGVGEDEIDRLANDVEVNVEEYKRVSIAAEDGSSVVSAVDESAERRRLEELKKRIVGAKEEAPAQKKSEDLWPKNKTLES
jgi:hypothetical protein